MEFIKFKNTIKLTIKLKLKINMCCPYIFMLNQNVQYNMRRQNVLSEKINQPPVYNLKMANNPHIKT